MKPVKTRLFLTVLLFPVFVSAYSQQKNSYILLFNGVYTSECYYDKGDDERSQDYLRLYPDAKVIEVATDYEATVEDLRNWFHLKAQQVGVGDYTINRSRIKFSTKSKAGVVAYKGRIINNETLKLRWKSSINGNRGRLIYKFVRVEGLQ